MRAYRFVPTLFLLAACSGRDPVAPGAAQPLDLARVFGELTLPSSTSNASVLAMPLGIPVVGFTLPSTPASCPYVATSKSFVCPTTTSNGISVSLAYQLLDASGAPQSQGDRATTNAVHTTGEVSGTLSQTGAGLPGIGPAVMTQRHDVTISGLLGDVHTIDGTAASTFGSSATGTTQQGAATIAVTATQTFARVRVPAPGTGPAYPLSGTITSDATATLSGTATTVHSVLTFDGTTSAALAVTMGGVTQHCRVSLVSAAPPACS